MNDAFDDVLLQKFGSQIVNVAALRGERLQAKPPSSRKVGIDWVPPMASLSIIVPSKVSTKPSERLRAVQLPKSFSWKNAEDLKNAGKGAMVLGQVRNQLTCGSCWAVAAATELSHRWSIAMQETKDLSETYLMACMSEGYSQQCNGGFPLEAGQFFEKIGTVSYKCYSYDWCENNSSCSQQGQGEAAGGSSSLIPPCSTSECLQCPEGGPNCDATKEEFKIYKAKPESTKQLVTIEDIKADLFTYGPVVAAYAVYADFLIGGGSNFSATGGVYINQQNSGKNFYGGDASASQQIMGFHAVTIIGWGEQEVDGFGIVPYWIIQNSWGTEWGDGGYWKHAMTDKERDINWKVGMDIPALFDFGTQGKQEIGGATTFLPAIDYKPTGGGNNGENGDIVNNNSNSNNFETKSQFGDTAKIIIGLILILILITLSMLLGMTLMSC